MAVKYVLKIEEVVYMKIRAAQPGDEQNIATVIINTWKVAYRGIVPDSSLDALTTEKHAELFRKNLADQREAIFVLEDSENQIVGMVSGGADRSGEYDCELVAIYILPDYQKQGYGKKLFGALVEEHKKHNYKSMILWTFKQNRDRNFYERLGGAVKEEKRLSFDGVELEVVAYTWENINEIRF